MPAVQTMGDMNDAGGAITTIPQSNVYVNGKLVCVDGSMGTDHFPLDLPHLQGVWQTTGGNATVKIAGHPVNTDGNADTCGHVRINGSGNVNVG